MEHLSIEFCFTHLLGCFSFMCCNNCIGDPCLSLSDRSRLAASARSGLKFGACPPGILSAMTLKSVLRVWFGGLLVEGQGFVHLKDVELPNVFICGILFVNSELFVTPLSAFRFCFLKRSETKPHAPGINGLTMEQFAPQRPGVDSCRNPG